LAHETFADVKNGKDPVGDKKKQDTVETITDLCELYMKRHSKPKKKASSIKSDNYMIEGYIKPKLGKMSVY